MDIEKLCEKPKLVEKEFAFLIQKKQIKQISENKDLANSFFQKARHNFSFYNENKKKEQYLDWLVVILYYALYHCALALITQKNYSSKNHYATILLLIKEYHISNTEAKLITELSISTQDAKLYTTLKEDRHNASYTTNTKFTVTQIQDYELQVLDFIQKTQDLLKK